jgi:signal transduction histidine kinase
MEADNEDKKYLHQQLIKLGDMMGDGLHLESGGRWISREYSKISKALYGAKVSHDMAVKRVEEINRRMAPALEKSRCTCGGTLKQARSGSLRACCTVCPKRYQLGTKKTKR